ncbi:MAG TPA: hypothetical protein VF546_05725 [Pyrinomonadaceae bacterium]|jgi:hypothetical protein
MPRLKHLSPALPALLLLLCLAPCARAQAPDADAPVRPGARATYLDFIKLALPDADYNDAGDIAAHKTVPVRDLFASDAPNAYEGALTLDNFDKLWLRDGARTRLCLLLHLSSTEDLFTWGELNVLALYEVEPRPRLLDAAAVQQDRFAGLWDEQPTLRIGPRKDAAIVANSHHNSTQGYLALTLVAAERDRLAVLYDRGGITHSNSCGTGFETTYRFTPLPQRGTAYYPIRLRATFLPTADDRNCQPLRRIPRRRLYQTLLRFHPTRRQYLPADRGLAPLAKYELAF